MLGPRESPEKSEKDKLKAVLCVLRREVGNRGLLTDDEWN
jgi:hypothetical protein